MSSSDNARRGDPDDNTTIGVKRSTKWRLEEYGTMTDTHDCLVNRVLDRLEEYEKEEE